MDRQDHFLWHVQRPSVWNFLLAQKISAPSSDSNWQVLLRDCRATLVSDRVGYWSFNLHLFNFIFECRSRHFEHLRLFFFFPIPFPHSYQLSWHSPFLFCSTFYTLFGPSTMQNSESLENWSDEVLRLISSPGDIRTTCAGDIMNTRKKKCRRANC